MLNYREQVKENSILNTANVFGVFTSLLMLRWIKQKGIASIEQENNRKAQLLYDALDNSSIFTPHVKVKEHRSLMNVTFTMESPEQEKKFLAFCEDHSIVGIKGHRSVGGFRVSLYNAIPLDAVERLVSVMADFQRK
jgi:phosphoserine aminotransferase